jgi:iron complex outermembrane receptor protein
VTATAQDEASDLGEVGLEELGNIKVYSASKHLQSASDAPASVTVVTAAEIQTFGYRNLADIVRSVPGFYVTYDRDYSFVGVRGFGRLGDWNSRILVLIDGHRINNNVLGQAMMGNEFPVDVDMIERVEIVCGPSSSLYGANAFFAVINVMTRKAKQVKDWELSFQTGSFGTYEGRASYGHEFNGLGVLLSGTFYDSKGQTLFFSQFNSPATKDSRCRDYSAHAIRGFRQRTSERYSTIRAISTLTAINTSTLAIITGSENGNWTRIPATTRRACRGRFQKRLPWPATRWC